jgi:hypothetical protein
MMIAFLSAFIALSSGISATAAISDSSSPYDFTIPPSANIANVKMLHAASAVGSPAAFIKTESGLPTIPTTHLEIWTFLIEHPKLKRRVLFDFGIRKDVKNLAPAAYEMFASPDGDFPFNVSKDISEQLVDGGVPLQSIDTLIWRSVLERTHQCPGYIMS